MKITKAFFKKLTMYLLIVMLGFVTPSIAFSQSNTIVAQAAAAKPKISKTKNTIYVGSNFSLTLKNVKNGIKWSTSKKSVAAVKAKGAGVIVTGKKAGKATITATYKKKTYKCVVTVKNKPVSISATKKTITEGQSFDLSLKNAGSGAKWSTSNKKIATIKKVNNTKYKITAQKAGTVNIKVTYKGKNYTCKVTVKKKKENTSTKSRLSCGTSLSLLEFSTKTISLSGDSTGSVWSIENTSIAKLEKVSEGKYNLLTLKTGKTNLVVKQNGETFQCAITVDKGRLGYIIMVNGKNIGKESSIPINGSEKLTLSNIRATNGNPKWTTSNNSVVELVNESDGACRVYGLRPGTAVVTLEWYGVKYDHTVTVTNRTVKRVGFSPKVVRLKAGDTASVTLEGATGTLRWGLSSGGSNSTFSTEELNEVIPNGTLTTCNTYKFRAFGRTDDNCYVFATTEDGTVYSCQVIVE